MEVTCLFPSPRFDFSSNTRYVHVEGPARNEQSANNELRPLFLPPFPSPINMFLADEDDWDEKRIRARGEKLCRVFLKIWPRPASA